MVIKNSVIRINMIPDFCFIIFIEYFKKGLRRSHMVYNSSVLLPLDDEQFFLFLFTVSTCNIDTLFIIIFTFSNTAWRK